MQEKIMDWLKRLEPQYRLPQAALVSVPFLAQRYSQSHSQSPIVWPPLGSLETYGAYVAMIVVGLCSLLPRALKNKQQAKSWLTRTIAATFVVFVLYSVLVQRYVITVDTPSDGRQTRSVGFIVEPRILALFPVKNHPELLRIGGLEDWQIQKVWTPNSVLALRLSLLITLTVALSLANVAVGSASKLGRRK